MLDINNYLNDLRKDAENTYALVNPHTLDVVEDVPECTDVQMEEAIQRAGEAFNEMKSMPSVKRSTILDEASRKVAAHKELFAHTIVKEAGKPIRFARGEVARAVETLKFSAIEARKLEGESIRLDAAPNGEGRDAYTIYEPIGVVGAITPFNFPLNLVVHKVGPAIAAGNTIVVKPAEKTPLSAMLLREALVQSGLPEDAFLIITGDGPRLGKVLLNSSDIQKITFTGSPEVGKLIKSQAGLKKVTLELGNNSALYVDESMRGKLKQIAAKTAVGAFAYNGQVCISTQRIYVHASIADAFKKELIQEVNNMQYGDPSKEATDVSALIDDQSQDRLMDWIEEAKGNGAAVIAGGEKVERGIKPTILTDVKRTDKISCQEVFGPLALLNTVSSAEEALHEMNESEYGLNAGVFTTDLSQAMQFGHELDVGQVFINDVPTLRFDHMPYGGRKNSGYGYEGVKYAIHEMVNRKLISLNYTF
ncbi:aldehyde dehydrogenase family protein [Thalassobacillus sp. CUG 92003]|uniref:aldehyde dehydrogenase family protein n=1 Tax=Thalassobacillus sp. CUG 92003 TaxID=2736641 RepID=UPI0015E7B7BB|nr:aldehyde dehydrogenase family protein [Thalassobacillus sp. CUG 92003]